MTDFFECTQLSGYHITHRLLRTSVSVLMLLAVSNLGKVIGMNFS